jgi:general secretion pathway protein L
MPSTLLVWLLEPPRFVLIDSATRTVRQSGSDLNELPPALKVERTIALAPGELISALNVPLAQRQRGKQLKALGFLLEDELAEDLDGVRWATTPSAAGVDVLLTAQHRLKAWLDRLGALGFSADALLPDYLALPEREQPYSAGSRWLIRLGEHDGASAEPELIEALWRERAPDQPLPSVRRLEAADLARGVDLNAPGLLTGSLAKDPQHGAWWPMYRYAIAASVLAALVGVAVLGFEVWRLERDASAINAEMIALYREVAPDAKVIVDPRAQLKQRFNARLSGAGASGGQLLLTALAQARHNAPGLKVRTLGFRDGTLEADLTARSLADLDRLMATLGADTRVRAEVKSAASGADGVSARVLLRGAPA